MFLRLEEFQSLYGHSRVPQKWAEDKQLALWVTTQRRMYAKGRLQEDRQRKLSKIGFVWNINTIFDDQWERYYRELIVFRRVHGHCRVPGKYEKLASWIERQRVSKVKNLLSANRERRLDKIGFIWSFGVIKTEFWAEQYRQLYAFNQKHGHSFVPVNCRENKSLGTWVSSQRRLESKGKLSACKKKKLSELGFVWSGDTKHQLKSDYETRWETSFKKLKTYRQKHGSCQVSLKIDPVLQRWTRWQRKLFHQSRLSSERIGKLNEIHFPWSVQEGYWMRMYKALKGFYKQYGHTRVPYGWAPNPQLAAWIYRTKRNRSELTPQKIELLSKIDFDWTINQRNVVPWREMYNRLVAYKQAHGHTRVPVKWKEDPKLGKWVSRMRHEIGKLASERVSLLEAVGFCLDSRLAAD